MIKTCFEVRLIVSVVKRECFCVQTQLTVSEQKIQDMIRERVSKIEKIKMTVTDLEVKHTNTHS